MPELPDVEGFRQVLESCARRRVIRRVEVRDTGVLHGVSARRLRDALEGRRFAAPERHGKWLLARTTAGGPTVLLHFGMTGLLLCRHPDDPPEPHDRVLFTVGADRRLHYRDQRKLRGLWLADDESAVDRLLADQGPDALAVDRAAFEAALTTHRGGIKSVLTDQHVLAGSAICSPTRSCGVPGCARPVPRGTSPRPNSGACSPTCAAPCAPRSPRAGSRPATPGSPATATSPARSARAAAPS